MAVKHADPGKVIDLIRHGGTRSTALVKTKRFEVMRLVVKPKKPLPPHQVDGPITVQCLNGRCTFFISGEPHELKPGAWLHLRRKTMHAVEAQETTVLLVTILFGS